jgi:SPOR domain
MPRRRADQEDGAMSDERADETELEVGDEDRLPWLEAVEEEEGGEGPSVTKLIAAIVIGLVAIGVIVGGLFWLGNRGGPGAGNEVIAAPEGDYKARPDQPGGMNVSGEGDVSAAASAGAQPKGNLNVDTVPEAPVTRTPPAQYRPAPTPAPTPAPPRPAPAPYRPAPPPAAGATIQLGAFSTQAGANGAWTNLSRRFRYLAPLSHAVVPAQVGARTLYRLRASGADAASVCRRLQVAGEACSVVD